MLKLARRTTDSFRNNQSRGTYNAPPRQVMTAEQAARYLGICHKTLMNMVNSGAIPCRKTGRKYLFSVEVVEKWLKCEPAENRERGL